MYRFQRSVEAKEGHLFELMGVAKEVAALMVQVVPEVEVLVFTDAFGNPQQVLWQLDYESLAQYEAVRDKWMGNESFVAFAHKIATLIVEGSARDMLWRGV